LRNTRGSDGLDSRGRGRGGAHRYSDRAGPRRRGLCHGFVGKEECRRKAGAVPIDYRTSHVEEYVAAHTNGKGFDIVFDTVGGATLDASFAAVKRYGHVVSALGWGTHSLAPLSFRGATYSGVFTLLPLITGEDRARQGKILAHAAALAEEGKLRPLLYSERFSAADIEAAQAVAEKGSLGKVVVEL